MVRLAEVILLVADTAGHRLELLPVDSAVRLKARLPVVAMAFLPAWAAHRKVVATAVPVASARQAFRLPAA